MTSLVDTPGCYRRYGATLMGHGRTHLVGPPVVRVPRLMADLLAWLDSTSERWVVEMTRPELPGAKNQKYRLTALRRVVR